MSRSSRPCRDSSRVVRLRSVRTREPTVERGTPVTTAPSASDLHFEPPGPGTWERDPVHFPRPVSRYWATTHPDAFARGTAEMSSYYGLLLGRMVMQYPNGFAYICKELAPEDEFPARFARASEALATKA